MKNEWFKKWFESNDYLNVYNHRDEKDAHLLIELVIKTINPAKDKIFLDAACGFGRHTLLLSSLGYKVIGFDLSRNLLKVAKENSLRKNIKLDLLTADLRTITFKRKIDVVLNLFTSFGYFENDDDNFRFIKNSIHFLNKDGFYVIDFINNSYLKRNLIPESEKSIGGKIIQEFREIKDDRVNKKILIRNGDNFSEYCESVKLYEPGFIINQFQSYGYSLVKKYGDYTGNEFSEHDSPRLILFFQR